MKLNVLPLAALMMCLSGSVLADFAFADVVGWRMKASPSSPPLETHDAGTLGPFGLELNISDHQTHSDNLKLNSLELDFNLGINEQVLLRFAKHADSVKLRGKPAKSVWGGSLVGAKWRFLDSKTLKLAIFPSFTFADGSNYLAEGRNSKEFCFPLIIARDFGEYATILNFGYRVKTDGDESGSTFLSVALGKTFGESFRVMTEVVGEIEKGRFVPGYDVGFVTALQPSLDSIFAISLYASIGQSFAAPDGGTETRALGGVSLAKRYTEGF